MHIPRQDFVVLFASCGLAASTAPALTDHFSSPHAVSQAPRTRAPSCWKQISDCFLKLPPSPTARGSFKTINSIGELQRPMTLPCGPCRLGQRRSIHWGRVANRTEAITSPSTEFAGLKSAGKEFPRGKRGLIGTPLQLRTRGDSAAHLERVLLAHLQAASDVARSAAPSRPVSLPQSLRSAATSPRTSSRRAPAHRSCMPEARTKTSPFCGGWCLSQMLAKAFSNAWSSSVRPPLAETDV